jgi:hypothetical protein
MERREEEDEDDAVGDAGGKPGDSMARHDGEAREDEQQEVGRQMNEPGEVGRLAQARQLGFADHDKRLFVGDLLHHPE